VGCEWETDRNGVGWGEIDARIALVGFPSVGKSTLLSKITKTKAAVAAYAFTTLTAIPGVMEYGGAEIQILDLPGIIEGAAEGKGRGRQVISAAKTSDLIMMVLDATKKAEQRALLEKELEAVGIRLNRKPPNIYLKVKKAGGMKINFMSPPKYLDEKVCVPPSRVISYACLTPSGYSDDFAHLPRLQDAQLRSTGPR